MIQSDLFRSGDAPVLAAWGAGVDSSWLITKRILRGERLDYVLHADTGDEKEKTKIFRRFFMDWLAMQGVPVAIVRYEPKDFKNYPPYRTLSENCLTNGTLPSITFGFGSCSEKWKIAPQNRWAKSWEPAVACWAAGRKVIKLIGYDAGPRDKLRYAQAVGIEDPLYDYQYPLMRDGETREDCTAGLEAVFGFAPPKSACIMCAATKAWELHFYTAAELRRVVLIEARAAPRLTNIEGIWRNGSKGTRGGEKKPGRMTDYIRDKGLLPAHEIDEIWNSAPRLLLRFQAAQAGVPIEDREELAYWLRMFDLRDAGAFGALYEGLTL